jgi:hypothetical protein
MGFGVVKQAGEKRVLFRNRVRLDREGETRQIPEDMVIDSHD